MSRTGTLAGARRAPRPRPVARLALLLAAGAAAAPVAPAAAQGIRIRGTSWARYVELRPFVDDSVAVGSVTGDGPYRRTAAGVVARCDTGDEWCRYKRSGVRESTIPLVQDLEASMWGLAPGLSAHAALRGRTAGGSAPGLWPRSTTDRFDALEAYVQLDRRRLGGRLGRQWIANGLGVYNFDGAALTGRPIRALTLDAWGGRSLVLGLNAGYTTSELAAIDELPPDRAAWVMGAGVQWRPSVRGSVRAAYQRELRDNRSGLYSERVTADAAWRLGRTGLDGAYTMDVATGDVNEARLRGRVEGPWRTSLAVEGWRFRPFFPLWTIWGAFSPVGFDEARADLGWATPGRALLLTGRGAWRRWQDTDAGLTSTPLRRTGWRLGGDALWRPLRAWAATARYDADVGFGAARSEGDVGVRWDRPGTRLSVGATASAWQSIFELRVGTERVLGLALDAGLRLTDQVRVVGDVASYRTDARNGAPLTDWGQRRASLRLEWGLGGDPGLRLPGIGRRPRGASGAPLRPTERIPAPPLPPMDGGRP